MAKATARAGPVHHLLTISVAAGARLAAGGTYQDLFTETHWITAHGGVPHYRF